MEPMQRNPAANPSRLLSPEPSVGASERRGISDEPEHVSKSRKRRLECKLRRQLKRARWKRSTTSDDERPLVFRDVCEEDIAMYTDALRSARKHACGSCGEYATHNTAVTYPCKKVGEAGSLEDWYTKTFSLLQPLAPEDEEFDESWLFTAVINRERDEISLCASCNECLKRKTFSKFSKRNGFHMFDDFPEELSDLNVLEIKLLSIVIPTTCIFRRHHYQQLHGIGLTITFWNSSQSIVSAIPRSPESSFVILLKDEHGQSMADDIHIRFEHMMRGIRYLKQCNARYENVHVDQGVLRRIVEGTDKFISTSDPDCTATQQAATQVSSSGAQSRPTDPIDVSDDEESESAPPRSPRIVLVLNNSGAQSRRTDPTDVSDDEASESAPTRPPPNVFVLNNDESVPLKELAINAFN